MNKLSYGLLSLLSCQPLTGYDLMLKLKHFWKTTHSAIYPLLPELEQLGYVSYKVIAQQCKPDKKEYHITDNGMKILKSWLLESTDPPVVRDEMILKTFCIHVLDKHLAIKLLDEFEDNYKNKINKHVNTLKTLMIKEECWSTNLPSFGSYILLQKSIQELKLGVQWCQWVKELYIGEGNLNLFEDFFKGEFS